MTDDRDEEPEAHIIASLRAKESRSAAEEHLLAVLSGTAPEAPEIRPMTFAPDDIEGLRAYVAEEVELNGGLSDTVLLMLLELGIGEMERGAAMDILDAAPRLSDRPLI